MRETGWPVADGVAFAPRARAPKAARWVVGRSGARNIRTGTPGGRATCVRTVEQRRHGMATISDGELDWGGVDAAEMNETAAPAEVGAGDLVDGDLVEE